MLFYTVILKQLLDMNELNKNIYGLKILTILETLKIYKLMLFTITTCDLKKLRVVAYKNLNFRVNKKSVFFCPFFFFFLS